MMSSRIFMVVAATFQKSSSCCKKLPETRNLPAPIFGEANRPIMVHSTTVAGRSNAGPAIVARPTVPTSRNDDISGTAAPGSVATDLEQRGIDRCCRCLWGTRRSRERCRNMRRLRRRVRKGHRQPGATGTQGRSRSWMPRYHRRPAAVLVTDMSNGRYGSPLV